MRASFRTPLVFLICMLWCSCSAGAGRSETGDPRGCADRGDAASAVPLVRGPGDLPRLDAHGLAACLSGHSLRVGLRRVRFSPARAGDDFSSELRRTLEGAPAAPPIVDLWAPANAPARDVLLVTQALGRAGAEVRLIASQDGSAGVLARVPPRRVELPELSGDLPDQIDLWVEMTPHRYLLRETDGTFIPIEGEPRARLEELARRLREQRYVRPRRRRLTFAPRGALAYAEWAQALVIAASVGFEWTAVTPVGVLETITREIGARLLAREGGAHVPLPLDLRRPPRTAQGDSATDAESQLPRNISVSGIEVGGSLDGAEIAGVARQNLPTLASCRFPSTLREARISLSFVVQASGAVRGVEIGPADERNVRGTDLTECLRARVDGWVFPLSPTGAITGVRLWLTAR